MLTLPIACERAMRKPERHVDAAAEMVSTVIDPTSTEPDIWYRWLLDQRAGGDAACEEAARADVQRYADRVLDSCRLKAGDVLADIGSGDGAVAFRAIERIGPSLHVIVSDKSAPLLAHARLMALRLGVIDQCSFTLAGAESLESLGTASVDAVTTRAVLAYVDDKASALREFHRILKPGGRLSIAEPLMQDDAIETIALRRINERDPSTALHAMLPLIQQWKAAQFPDTPERLASSPHTNYSERDLLAYVQECGYVQIHLELHIDLRAARSMPWEAFLRSSPHPWAPTHGAIFGQNFTPAEQRLLEEALRPSVEAGTHAVTERVVYISAMKAKSDETHT